MNTCLKACFFYPFVLLPESSYLWGLYKNKSSQTTIKINI
ncbi:hypothetical protein HMPREF9441_01581 [Paraprevotella clara YIT 11840]|uniref:Uncharacterized protein n=1 Tax=Paraprevotella clara YIT 11840 TaxID=762968 RepID=G5SQE3_9BACT|nr:hypothetical protein HMPREF9441_01581 [Paraprevotella clara YIT 11840]